jgi:hypothetical protein
MLLTFRDTKPDKQLQHSSRKQREKTVRQRPGERKRRQREKNCRGGAAAAAVITRR